ncbi:protein Mp1R-MYB16 [Marchantia polymorpha subsp. ruderalis]|uniref:Myb-like domain-containing protein n=2 Tax=Marchantia polymorpha TaxID=3197 RepID=A0AAF6BJQ1_MARPO|nr:hypothetical protein MARPO_0084s0085 [Marchantia polymorpha]BBN12235.1 hypothetical protein Mp_5g18370 [Marchantia polymorpha subsp. ruderalis]|eukprot:PTQ34023.1 hypothetical protein MARPO_0084s0085 [Marchantia polymorpha]
MLASVLPWEWILENVLDLNDFSLPCLKELISYIPHIEDSRCSKLLQKVALRYLEEIVLSRNVDPCAITLIKFIVKPHGGSSLRRIHSLRESVEYDLILRVETEVVLTTLRYRDESGGRDWEAFQDALEEIFPESSLEASKAGRRKELISVSLAGEQQDDLIEKMLLKYPLEDLLKDLLQLIESKRKLLKTKFLDQLAKDVINGSYTPSASRPSQDGLSTPTNFKELFMLDDSLNEHEGPDSLYPENEAVLPSRSHTILSTQKFYHRSPAEKFVKEPFADILSGRTTPSTPLTAKDGETVTRNEKRDLHVCEQAGEQVTPVDRVLVHEGLRLEMSTSMAEVDKVARGLTNQINELVDDIDKFAVDIHRVAVNSTEQTYYSGETDLAQEAQSKDPSSSPAEKGEKRPATEKLPDDDAKKRVRGSKKRVRGSLDTSRIGGGKENEEGYYRKARLTTAGNEYTASAEREDILTADLDCHAIRDGPENTSATSVHRLFLAFLRQSRLDQLVCKFSVPEAPVFKSHSSGLDSGCIICRRGGVLVKCHGCSVKVHDRCLDELRMRNPVHERHWFCPSCVEQLTLGILESVKAEAATARQEAIAFVLATGKHPGDIRSSCDGIDGRAQMTNSAVAFSVLQEGAHLKVSTKEDLKQNPDPESNNLDCEDDSEAEARKESEGMVSLLIVQDSNIGCPRPKDHSHSVKETDSPRKEIELTVRLGTISKAVSNHEDERPEPLSSPPLPTSHFNPDMREPSPVACENVLSTDATEETLATSTPPTECVEKDLHANPSGRNLSEEGLKALYDETSAVKPKLSGSGNPKSSQKSPMNSSKPGVDEGDGHDGDLEEDIHRHQDGGECSKENQPSDFPTPVDERTPPRKGRYRGRWKIPGVRRRNLPWSESEIFVLKEGVQKFSNDGRGFQWKNILEFGYGKFDPSRTTVDLKDKWRNLSKYRDTSPSS